MSTRITPDWDIREAILAAGGSEAFRCYQCGNCMAVCPWYHIEAVTYPVYRVPQSVRLGAVLTSDNAEVIEQEVDSVYRCVGCESCTTWCPHSVSLPDVLRSIRRLLVEFGSYPAELSDAVSRIASSGNPFGEPREKRSEWANELGLPRFEPGTELLYSPCCVPAYDPRARKVARATAAVLNAGGVDVGVLGADEACCGEAVRRVGAEEVFQEVAGSNFGAMKAAGVQSVVVTSPHCLVTFARDYPELGASFEARHSTQLFAELLARGRLAPVRPIDTRVVYHDPCSLGRVSGIYEEPRSVLRSIPGLELVEIPIYNRDDSICCGGGSGGIWMERPKGERLSDLRVQQAVEAGAEILAVACPYCLQMFEDSVKTMDLDLDIRDVAELLADAIGDVVDSG